MGECATFLWLGSTTLTTYRCVSSREVILILPTPWAGLDASTTVDDFTTNPTRPATSDPQPITTPLQPIPSSKEVEDDEETSAPRTREPETTTAENAPSSSLSPLERSTHITSDVTPSSSEAQNNSIASGDGGGGGLSHQAIIGIAVSAALTVVSTIIGIAVRVCLHRRKERRRYEDGYYYRRSI